MATTTRTLKCVNSVQAFMYGKIVGLLRVLDDGKDADEMWSHIEASLSLDGQVAGLSEKVAKILARVAVRNFREHAKV